MAAYEYLALTAEGKKRKGVLNGDSAKSVRAELRDSGLTPLEVNPVHESAAGNGKGPATRAANKRERKRHVFSAFALVGSHFTPPESEPTPYPFGARGVLC